MQLYNFSISAKYLFIVGGGKKWDYWPGVRRMEWLDKMEFFQIDSQHPVPPCLTDLKTLDTPGYSWKDGALTGLMAPVNGKYDP